MNHARIEILARFSIGPDALEEHGCGSIVVYLNHATREFGVQISGGMLPDGSASQEFRSPAAALELAFQIAREIAVDTIDVSLADA